MRYNESLDAQWCATGLERCCMKIILLLVAVAGAICLTGCAQPASGAQADQDKVKLNIMGDGKKPMPKLGASVGGL